MAILLGRDCSITAGGNSVSVRDVTLTETADEITVKPFASRDVFTYSTGYSLEVSAEGIDDTFYVSAVGWCESGETVVISGTGFSFDAVCVSVSMRQPLDDVCSYTAVFRRTNSGYRA